MKINPFWVATFIVLLLIGLLNFGSILRGSQDQEINHHLNVPRDHKEQVLHRASILENGQNETAALLTSAGEVLPRCVDTATAPVVRDIAVWSPSGI